MVGWKKPAKGWLKLNTDGSVQRAERRVGAGGLIRDEYGRWLQGFMINPGCCSVEEAELWAILHGLRMAWESGHKRFTLESDCYVPLQWLNG